MEKKVGDVKNKISYISGIVTTTVLNTKIGEVKNKIPGHSKYITNPEFNKLAATIFDTELKQANLVINTDVNAVSQSGNKINKIRKTTNV